MKCIGSLLCVKKPTPINPRAVNIRRTVKILTLKARCRKYVPTIMSKPRRKIDTLKEKVIDGSCIQEK
jgi:hypothetical protein